jgi:hypothetical protein
MENEQRKFGRPRTPQQILPLVLTEDRTLETIEVAIPEGTAKALAAYTAWVRGCRDMRIEEATTATIDYALREVFRRDRLWRDRQRSPQAKSPSSPPSAPSVSPRPPTVLPEPRPLPGSSVPAARAESPARIPAPTSVKS